MRNGKELKGRFKPGDPSEQAQRRENEMRLGQTLSRRRIVTSLLTDIHTNTFNGTKQLQFKEPVPPAPLARIAGEPLVRDCKLQENITFIDEPFPNAPNDREKSTITGYKWKDLPEWITDEKKVLELVVTLEGYKREADRAEEKLITNYLDLVNFLAHRQITEIPLEDMIGYGRIQLVKCVQKFDWREGVLLTSYATSSIDGAMKHADRDIGGSTINRSRSAHSLQPALERLKQQLTREYGIDPGVQELVEAAKKEGMDINLVEEILFSQAPLSLDTPFYQDNPNGGFLRDTIVDSAQADAFERVDNLISLSAAFNKLTPPQKHVLLWRHLPPDRVDHTLEYVASMLPKPVSKMQASRIERDALEKVRMALTGVDDDKTQRRSV